MSSSVTFQMTFWVTFVLTFQWLLKCHLQWNSNWHFLWYYDIFMIFMILLWYLEIFVIAFQVTFPSYFLSIISNDISSGTSSDIVTHQWRIQDFQGDANSRLGSAPTYFADLLLTTAWKLKNLNWRRPPPLDPPLHTLVRFSGPQYSHRI